MAAQSVHQTILRLLENTIKNPSDPKFKSIQASNKQIQLTILQYVEGVEILKLCGFTPLPADAPINYTNNLEIGMLKLCRGDLELAYRKS